MMVRINDGIFNVSIVDKRMRNLPNTVVVVEY